MVQRFFMGDIGIDLGADRFVGRGNWGCRCWVFEEVLDRFIERPGGFCVKMYGGIMFSMKFLFSVGNCNSPRCVDLGAWFSNGKWFN